MEDLREDDGAAEDAALREALMLAKTSHALEIGAVLGKRVTPVLFPNHVAADVLSPILDLYREHRFHIDWRSAPCVSFPESGGMPFGCSVWKVAGVSEEIPHQLHTLTEAFTHAFRSMMGVLRVVDVGGHKTEGPTPENLAAAKAALEELEACRLKNGLPPLDGRYRSFLVWWTTMAGEKA